MLHNQVRNFEKNIAFTEHQSRALVQSSGGGCSRSFTLNAKIAEDDVGDERARPSPS